MRFDPNARPREQDVMTTHRLDYGSSAEVVALCWCVLFFSSASTTYEITRTPHEKTFGWVSGLAYLACNSQNGHTSAGCRDA